MKFLKHWLLCMLAGLGIVAIIVAFIAFLFLMLILPNPWGIILFLTMLFLTITAVVAAEESR
jgi:hypothetical protein